MQPMHLRFRIWHPAVMAVMLSVLIPVVALFLVILVAQDRGCSWIVDEGSCSPPILPSVLAVLFLAGSLVLAIRFLWRLFVPRTFAMIDDEGVRFVFGGDCLVPWNQITGCGVTRFGRVVRLWVKDAAGMRDAWIACKPRLLRPFVRFFTLPVVSSVLFMEKRYTIFRIPAYMVDQRSAGIMDMIRARLNGGATVAPETPDAAPARRPGIGARVTQAACLAVFAAGLALSATGLYIWLPGGDPLSAETRALVEELAAADPETPGAVSAALASVEVDAAVDEMLEGMRVLGERERGKARLIVRALMAMGFLDNASGNAADFVWFADSSIAWPGEMTPTEMDAMILDAGVEFLVFYDFHLNDDAWFGEDDLGEWRGPLQEISWTLDRGKKVMAALVAMGDRAVPALTGALEDEDSFVRTNAASLLGRAGPAAAAAVPALARVLENDRHTVVLYRVAAALGNIGEAARGSIPQLIEILKDGNWFVYETARHGLTSFGELAVPALIDLLQDPDPDYHWSAADVLGDIGPAAEAAVPALARALEDSDEDVRSAAASALGNIGPAAEAAVPALARALEDPDDDVRSAVASTLGSIGPAAGAAVPALIGALDDSDVYVRSYAAAALGELGPVAQAAIPALLRVLRDGAPETRGDAAQALGRIGVASEAVVAGLIDALDDPGGWVHYSASDGLRVLGPEAIPAIIGALSDPDPGIRRLAADSLRAYGPEARAAIPALEALLEDPYASVRAMAEWALGEIKEDDEPSG